MAYIVTGTAGYDHIYPGDDAALNRGIFGSGDYFLATKEENPMAIEATAGNIQLPKMEILMQGYHCRIIGDEVVTISNGSLGNNRIDVICGKYTKNIETMTDTFSIEIVRGTPTSGTPAIPEITKGNIDAGQTRYCALFNVELQGLNVKGITRVIEKVLPAIESTDVKNIRSLLGFNSNGVLSESNGGRLSYRTLSATGKGNMDLRSGSSGGRVDGAIGGTLSLPAGTTWLIITRINFSPCTVPVNEATYTLTGELISTSNALYGRSTVVSNNSTTYMNLVTVASGSTELELNLYANGVTAKAGYMGDKIPFTSAIFAVRLF